MSVTLLKGYSPESQVLVPQLMACFLLFSLLFVFVCLFTFILVVVCFVCWLVILLFIISFYCILYLLLFRFISFTQAVLNAEILLLDELQLVAKGQEDAFTLHV